MELRKKILVVDDEEETLVFLGNILKRQNYEVITTTKGRDAIKLAKRLEPNLIILDVVLPDMIGGEVAKRLEEELATKEIPIVFLTGLFTKEEEFPGKKTGRRYIIAKPVTEEELLNVIQKAIS
jgi:DNA-binding response OmpR family regulator